MIERYVQETAGSGADLDPLLEAAGVESWVKADPAAEGSGSTAAPSLGGPDLARVREYRENYHRGMRLVAEAEEELGARTTDVRAAEAARAEAAAKVERLRGWANAQAQTAAWELDKILGV